MENMTVENVNTIISNLIRKFHTLLDCPERFSGDYGAQKIQHFIEYIQTYKSIKCITDDQALRELEYLLIEHAYTWWLRRKCHFTTWSEALTALQNQYAKQRPAHIIFKDIFDHSYGEYTTEEDFISDKYELLSELPDPKLTEKNKIDMIFGLLPNDKQSKLEYSIIFNVMDLKEQILKLKCSKNIAVAKQSDNSQSGETKDEINAHEEPVHETNQCENVESMNVTARVHTVNDKDPIIKVRRTEDLMPQFKEEKHDEANLDQQEEFISTENITTNHQTNGTTNFHIDTDIMNQINNIIDESERNESLRDNLQISSVMSVQESTPTTIAFLLNGETTIQAEVSSKSHPAVRVLENKIPRKLKARCSYCRKYGHKSQACLKRARHVKLFPEKFLPKPKPPADVPKEIVEVITLNSNNNDDVVHDTIMDTVTSIPPLVTNVPPLIVVTNTSMGQQAMPTSVAPTFSHNSSLPPIPPTFSHIAMTSVPPIFSHTTTLTTKLIAPINGPGLLNKQLAAKLRNINGPSPKCHQCGTVGFYKSICPNCSPIYNSNHYK